MDLLDHAEDYAKTLAGNHERFDSFAWGDRPEDGKNWTLVYTVNRDSDALDRSNDRVLAEELAPFVGWRGDGAECERQRHAHWACGWIEGYAIKVRDEVGAFTKPFLVYVEHLLALADYPIRSDDDFSEMEQEEADQTWSSCYNQDERVAYMREHWRDFEHCAAKWARTDDDKRLAWRTLLDNVRGRYFSGIASELIS